MEVKLQNIIYNPATAKADVERIQREQPGINKCNRIWNACMFLLIFLIGFGTIVAITILWISPDGHMELSLQWLPTYAIIGIALWIGVGIWETVKRDILQEYEWYDANAQYYRMTNGYNVLACHLNYHAHHWDGSSVYTVHVTQEDEKHVVSHNCFTTPTIRAVTRTDISEVTLDLKNQSVYIPYAK